MPQHRWFLLVLGFTAFGHAKTFDADAKIDAVTVYLDGATVSRSARLNVDAGEHTVRFSRLPAGLDESRIQVEIADSAVVLGEVKLVTQQRSEAINAEVRSLQAELAEARLKLQAITDADKSADLTLKFLESLAGGYAKESWIDSAQGNADINSWRAALNVLEDGANAAYQRKRDNEGARQQASKEVSRLQRELQSARGASRASAALEVGLQAANATPTQARLHYYVSGASWRPVYEARLNSNSGALSLAQRAQVRQDTVEEWHKVQLTLSTSEPEGNLLRPELQSEFLDVSPRTPSPRVQFSRSKERNAGLADAQAIEEVITTAAAPPPPVIGNFAVSYPVPGRVSVSNDRDDNQLFDLSRTAFDTQLLTQVVPRRSTRAFLAARFTYTEELPLPSSEMRVYVDGVYAGQSVLPTALPGAELTLPMGVDRRITVSAKDQGGQGGESGIIGKRKTEVTDFLFELRNQRERATLVEVFDRYPVSRDKSIEVKVPRSATEPSATDLEGAPGLIVWRKRLDGGDSWKIRHRYEVSYPVGTVLYRQ